MISRCCSWIGLALLVGACGPDKVDPPKPRPTATWTDTLPPVPQSYINGPVRYHLAPAFAWLDSTIPPKLGDLERRDTSPEDPKLSYAFQLERDPFILSVRRRSATLQTDLAYRVRAWYNPPVLPEISASCGDEGEAPRARVSVTMVVRLGQDWTLHPSTRAAVDALSEADDDKCTITPLEIDVTGDVIKAARKALQEKADDLDEKLAAVDLPAEARRIWGILHQPIRITDSLWLTIHPAATRIGPLELRGDTLLTMVGLSANPQVRAGPRPSVKAAPLPRLQEGRAPEPSLHMLTEGRLPYDVASAILTRELHDTRIDVAGQQLTIDSLHLAGVGDGRVAVGLAVSGAAVGLLYVVGHPAYDSASSKLFMPDLRYDIGTRNLLTGGLAWLAGEAVEEFLRSNIRIDLRKTMEDGRKLLEKSLNQQVAEGVRMRAEIRGGQVHDIRAAPEALLVRAIATGRAELVLEPKLP